MLNTILAELPANYIHGYVDSGFTAVDPSGCVWTMGIGQEDDGEGFATTEFVAIAGNTVRCLNWSRFEQYSPIHFKMLVEMGFPRPDQFGLRGNWTPSAISEAYAHRVAA